MTSAGILAALLEENKVRCAPPLPRQDLERIARSVARYEALPLLSEESLPGGQEPAAVVLGDFRAYLPEHRYIFEPTREMWPSSSVNSRIPPVKLKDAEGNVVMNDNGEPKRIQASTWLDQNRSVEQMTWYPGEPTLIEGRLYANGGWVTRPGCRTYNLYRPPTIEPGDPAKAGPWLDHVHRVYPAEAAHIIRYLAHRVQRPHEKINHALVLIGPQGTGKDTIIAGVIPAIGPWNVSEVSPDALMGRFNGFIKAVLLRVSEARDLGDNDRYRLYEHLTPIFATG
jgi:hypothetical protein